jgi:hypothetical protein
MQTLWHEHTGSSGFVTFCSLELEMPENPVVRLIAVIVRGRKEAIAINLPDFSRSHSCR